MQKIIKFGIPALMLFALFLGGCTKDRTIAPSTTSVNNKLNNQFSGKTVAMLVPSLNDPWTELLTQYAQQAADDTKAVLVIEQMNETSDELVQERLGGLAAKKALGLIIQPASESIGPSIRDGSETYGLTTMTLNVRVRDSFSGKLLDMPFFGVEQNDLGNIAATYLIELASERKWNLAKTGVILSQSAGNAAEKTRVSAMKAALLAAGVPESNLRIVDRGGSMASASSAATAIFNAKKDVTTWLLGGSVDEGVIGSVRASETAGINATNVIGIGIGGLSALEELSGPANGFVGSLLISPKSLGYDSVIRVLEALSAKEPLSTSPEYKNGVFMNRENLDAMKKEHKLDLLTKFSSKVTSSQQATADLKVKLPLKESGIASGTAGGTIESGSIDGAAAPDATEQRVKIEGGATTSPGTTR